MKTLTALAAVGLVAFGFVNSASAFSFSPISTKFKATGTTTLMKDGASVSCTVNLKGVVNKKGGAAFNSAVFSGSAACTEAQAAGLPWMLKATGAGVGKIDGVSIASPLGACGPSNVAITVSGAGVFAFNNAKLTGGCVVTGSYKTKPAITIVP
jgi:hypothetical protein